MPFGVSQDFLKLAKAGQRTGLARLAWLAPAALAGAFVAEMLDETRMGAFFLLYVGALAAGLGLGALGGWLETRAWGESLKGSWQGWMHAAVGAGSMGETARRAGSTELTRGKLLMAGLLALNGACLIAAWFTLPPFTLLEAYGILAVVTVALTGLAVGAVAVIGLVEAWWCRMVEHQTLELVRQGRIGVWGIR